MRKLNSLCIHVPFLFALYILKYTRFSVFKNAVSDSSKFPRKAKNECENSPGFSRDASKLPKKIAPIKDLDEWDIDQWILEKAHKKTLAQLWSNANIFDPFLLKWNIFQVCIENKLLNFVEVDYFISKRLRELLQAIQFTEYRFTVARLATSYRSRHFFTQRSYDALRPATSDLVLRAGELGNLISKLFGGLNEVGAEKTPEEANYSSTSNREKAKREVI